ncbi:MAG: hypothetical protein ABI999_07360 [Acidobacteriota bacterium]
MKKKAIKAKLDKTKKKLVKAKSKLTETLSELESVKRQVKKPVAAAASPAKSASVRKSIRKSSPSKKRETGVKPSLPATPEAVVSELERVSEPTQELAATNGQG